MILYLLISITRLLISKIYYISYIIDIKMNLFEASLDFHKKNIVWLIINIIFVFAYYPLEMIVFGFLFGKIFSKIGDIKKNINSILYLIGIIIIAYVILESIGYVKERFDSYYFPKMNHDIRLQMIDVIYKKISTNYESINNGEFVGRLLKIPNFLSFFFEQIKNSIEFFISWVKMTKSFWLNSLTEQLCQWRYQLLEFVFSF